HGGTGKNRRQTSKFIRWKERLGAYDFKILHIPGPRKPVADYLSHLKAKATQLDVALKQTSPTVAAITLADLARASSQDEQLTQVSAAQANR
ncbi:MAG: hypothetical protein GY696_22495, partial [Gammaproteobacteria bacterium]|nr:hypothetical protein [Gammaproteobacteria bacterium]